MDCYLEGLQIEQRQSMNETEGGFGETDRVLQELRRTAARWHTLMEQQSVEGVNRSGQLGHLQRLDQLRRVGQFLLDAKFRARRLTVPPHKLLIIITIVLYYYIMIL